MDIDILWVRRFRVYGFRSYGFRGLEFTLIVSWFRVWIHDFMGLEFMDLLV